MDLADYLNAPVTLYGIADNAAAGAVLRCGPTAHVYIDGLSRWSEDERYGTFEVVGTLIEVDGRHHRPAAGTPVTHSLDPHYMVTNATWTSLSC